MGQWGNNAIMQYSRSKHIDDEAKQGTVERACIDYRGPADGVYLAAAGLKQRTGKVERSGEEACLSNLTQPTNAHTQACSRILQPRLYYRA